MTLGTITGPLDLKSLSVEQLQGLCTEIRQRIIEVMSINGGHLSSNLGAVELTVALHYVFDAPHDKMIWDVSHQTYAHKLLTGRTALFHKVRQYNGLCGFCNPKESPYDHFFAGHAGTALSLALGTAHTRDLQREETHVIPIVGDAGFTCGLTLEALNNIRHDMKRFILILNDNAMSISKNVGAITRILGRLINSPASNKFYHGVEQFLGKIPSCGQALASQGKRLKASLKQLVSTAPFFEQYGLSYVGPVDGHDLGKLIDLFTDLKDQDGPLVIHVNTVKGHGMEEAMKNGPSYHGVRPFDKMTGKMHPTKPKPTFPKIFGNQILKMAEEDTSIIAVTPAMSFGSCLDAMMEKFPDRCLDVGIAEGHALTFCGGLALGGKVKVVMSVYATFLQRAFDNLFHDICLQELPVVFAIDRAGISGPDGYTHHGVYDISFLNAMPNMVICQPRNGQLLRELMLSSFGWQKPTAIRYPNLATDDAAAPLQPRPLGRAEVLVEGREVLILALGHMCETALKVHALLKAEGVHATVVDPIFVKPLDAELLAHLLLSHRMLVTIEEHSTVSGLGAVVNHFLMTNGYTHTPVLNFGVPERYLAQGSHQELLQEIGLVPDEIARRIAQHAAVSDLSYNRA